MQQQLFVFPVLLGSAGEQLEGRLLEERQSLGQRSQLYQVQEVEVAEPLGPLAGRQLCIKTLSELGHVVAPLLLKPAVCRGSQRERESDNQFQHETPVIFVFLFSLVSFRGADCCARLPVGDFKIISLETGL